MCQKLKLSNSFLDKFLQALRLNFIITRVILLSVLVSCSAQKSTFSTTFLLSCIMKHLKHPYQMCQKKTLLCGSVSNMLHQWVSSLSELSVLAIVKGYFLPFLWYYCFVVNKYIHLLAGKTSTKSSFISGLSIYFWAFSIWKLLIPLLLVKEFFLNFFDSVICNVWIKHSF